MGWGETEEWKLIILIGMQWNNKMGWNGMGWRNGR